MDKAWGENRYTWGDTPTSFQYTGQRKDAIIGLYFYNARYYDSYLGRFIQADTIVPSPGDPQQLNRFSYVRNNPLKLIDPTGHSCASPMDTHEKSMCNEWEQAMLDSTVIIYMEGYYLEEFYSADGTKVRKSSFAKTSGLGTIVDSNVIYTHDHSSLLLGDNTVLTKFEIYDANGTLLASPSSYPKPSYDTPGLMSILTLEKGTVNLGPTAEVGNPTALKAGDEIAQVVRAQDSSGTPRTQWGEFVGWREEGNYVITRDGREPLNLVAFRTTVGLRGGDSGGGAFHNGRWVGANWSAPNSVGVPFPPLDVRPE